MKPVTVWLVSTVKHLRARSCHQRINYSLANVWTGSPGSAATTRINCVSNRTSFLFTPKRHFHASCCRRGMDISSVQLAGHNTCYQPDWNLQECRVTSNTSSKSPDGIEFQVRYIDTAASLDAEQRDKMPVVVATHGSPGSYKDLVLVLEPLIDKGARLILPNMPGFDYTQFTNSEDKWKFTHTTAERLDFVENFLQTINVDKVDFVCGHSAGCYPITVLSSKWPSVKAAALVSPAPGHTYPKAAEPWWLTCGIDWLVRQPLTHAPALWLLGRIGTAVSGIPAKNIYHMVAVMQNATGITFSMVMEAVDALVARNFPVVFFYCHNDPIVRTRSSKEYAAKLRVRRTHVYSKEGEELGTQDDESLPADSPSRAVLFMKRTHYPQKDPRLLEVIKAEVSKLYVETVGEKSYATSPRS